MPLLVTSTLIGFLLGGLPSGLWIGRARGVDLRTAGSRNVGATNAYRVLGARWGILVFALDAAKGFLAALIPVLLVRAAGGDASPDTLLVAKIAGGMAAIVGHVFSPWLGFRGGRGVAASLGVFLAIAPTPTLLALGLWILLVLLTRRVSVGSIGAALAYPFLVLLLLRGDPHRVLLSVIAAVVALLVIVRHKANIERLLSGTEPPILDRKQGRVS
ncbi:MAG: glycerol-3-phosphate 1-O-acyltransferase PlsY [Candidatus Eisenbacteria bacterium]|uniref:Glycerol-3-phosphate acyltransferase n=1 Tax=Eiseniibacteriota bacterium TaxID=2212470 RepID=A0A538T649_UNCEI|nr:MAG: glycerol-3-phosphate 1-O-acyltransferase PlsY [Candidatus Eisenbacteria bacterium]